jgi:hypothetical protein
MADTMTAIAGTDTDADLDALTRPEGVYVLPSGAELILKPDLTGAIFIDFLSRSIKVGTEAQKGILPKLFTYRLPDGEAEETTNWPKFLASLDFFDGVALFGQNGILNQVTTPPEMIPGHLPSGLAYALKDRVPMSVFEQYQARVNKAVDTTTGQVIKPELVAAAQAWAASKLFTVENEDFTEADVAAMLFMDAAVLMTEAGKCVRGIRTR